MNVLKVIIYFSIFKYPLKKEEIFAFSSKQNIEVVDRELETLLEKKIIFQLGEFYSCKNDHRLVERRLKGNNMAAEVMPKALKSAKLIAAFPFVESVAISGALSKKYFDKNGDVDFFIITKAKHLWLSRTLLVLFKKMFLLNSKKYFCVNYFIGSNKLKIQEQNKFTATELVTLLPIYGKSIFSDFIKTNQWAFQFYPNKTIDFSFIKETRTKPPWSKVLELLFANALGQRFDKYLKALTIKKWKSKFKHLDKNVFEIAMKSTNDVSKHHPQDFQSQVIVRLNKQYADKNKTYNLNLSKENA